MPTWEEVENSPTYQGANEEDRNRVREHWDNSYGNRQEVESATKLPINPERTFLGSLGDVGVTAAKAGVGLGDAVIGLGDLVSMGGAGKAIEDITGYKSDKVHNYLEGYYSDAQQAANRKVSEAEGFLGTLDAALKNPSTIAHTALESVPMMLGGAAIARGVMKAGAVASPYLASAIGEGTMAAGSTAESIRQQTESGDLNLKQTAMAAGAGIGTGVFGFAGARLSKALGVGDVDTMLATGKFAEKSSKGVARRIAEGGISEGIFEELPQSMQEQVWMNAALDKPLNEGIGEAGAMGLLTGGLMGGGANIITRVGGKDIELSPQEQEVNNSVEAILSYGEEQIVESITGLNEQIDKDQELLNDAEKLDNIAVQMNIEPDELVAQLVGQTEKNKQIVAGISDGARVQEEQVLQDEAELTDKERLIKDTKAKLSDQRTDKKPQIITPANEIDEQIQILDKQYQNAKTQNLRDYIEIKLVELNEEKAQITKQDETREDFRKRLDSIQTDNLADDSIDDLMNDFFDQSADIQDNEDTKYRKRKFNQLSAKTAFEKLDQKEKELLKLPDGERGFELLSDEEASERRGDTKKQLIESKIQEQTDENNIQIDQLSEQLKSESITNKQEIRQKIIDLTQRNNQLSNELRDFDRPESKIPAPQLSQVQQKIKSQEDQIRLNESRINSLEQQRNIITKPHQQDIISDRITKLQNENDSIKQQIDNPEVSPFTDEPQVVGDPQFQITEDQDGLTKVNLEDIEKAFKNQNVTQADDGTISVQFKNGKGLTIKSMQDAGQGFVKLAIETGQMLKDGKIFGITVGNEILLDAEFADSRTLWHENKHVLDNLGMITKADNSLLNKEFNKLRKANKLGFAISTHKNSIQAMTENRANMFAQIMVNREDYRNSPIGKTIQKIMDFFDKLLAMGQQSIAGLAGEVESGKIYERTVDGKTMQTTVSQNAVMAAKWYSQVENVVAGFKQKQAMPEQWKGMIKNQPGIKQEELDWMGLDDWLADQSGKITQKDLLEFVRYNNVQVEEVVKSTEENIIDKVNKELIPLGYAYEQEYDTWELVDKDGNLAEQEFLPDSVKIILDKMTSVNSSDPTKYDDYQLPGGSNYKELLLTLPNKETSLQQDAQAMFGKSFEDLSSAEGMELKNNYEQRNKGYTHGHWPGITNPLAHVRFNERTDADGNKVLFIEEVQSDWHQEGRKEGYAQPVNVSDWRIEATGEKNNLGRHLYKLYDGDVFKNNIASILSNPETLLQKLKDRTPQGVSDAPFKKSWPLLTMKRMVRYAAENGFDKIAWTTGQQQADRYGEDDINAEGMKKFYDKMLPSIVNKEFNRGKWGKAKVGVTSIDKIDQLSLPITDRMKSKALNEGMALFNIADIPISEQVLGGLINKKTETNTKSFKDWFGRSVGKTKQGEPLVFYHGTNEVFEEFTKDDPKMSRHLSADLGHFFTLKKGVSEHYGQHQIPAYLKLEKPYKMSLKESQSFNTFGESEQRQAELIREGYDSIIAMTGDSPYVIIFESGQAKSIHNQGDWSHDSNIYFEVREGENKQKIPDATYNKLFQKKESMVKKLAQTARMRLSDIKLITDKSLGSISTRLKNVSQELSAKIRILDFNTAQKIQEALKVAQPLLETANNDMSKEDKFTWDLARKESDSVKLNQIAQKYGMINDQKKLRDVLDKIRQEAIDVGYDVGFIDEYWPRVIKDREGFLQATEGISNDPVFTNAIKAQAEKLGITAKEFEREFPEVKADIISNLILGRNSGIGGPGSIQGRVFETIPEEYLKFYMDSDAALMQYIYSMTKKIEARKFFGKVPKNIANLKTKQKKIQADLSNYRQLVDQAGAENPEAALEYTKRITNLNNTLTLNEEKLNNYKFQRDYTENIGTYIDDLRMNGTLKKKDEKMVRDILDARFHEHGTTGITNAYKNLAYIDTMGSPISAVTQIGDLAWAMYVGKVWTPKGFSDTVKNITKSTLGKSNITKEDIGITRIAQEFADGTTLGNAVSKVFKVVGLEKMDSIGKETLINNARDQYKLQAQNDLQALIKQIKPIFGAQSNSVVKDLLADNASDNVKLLVYSRLLDFQPAALSEMPEFYLKGGNGRIVYMLKTYTLKQFDVFRKEVWHNIKSGEPDQIKDGIVNMVQLMTLLTFANAGADEIKDFMLGKETKFEDHVIENFLTIGGANRYVRMQMTREGIGSGIAGQILPPFKFINSLGKDVFGNVEDGWRSVDSIPVGGKLYYWHVGRGADYRKSVEEKDFSQAGKDVRKFKKQFEESNDKRLFLQSNTDDFKQMKVYDNFNNKLRGNKATINKLEKLEQTPNVMKRLGQLEAQREMFLNRYFEVARSL